MKFVYIFCVFANGGIKLYISHMYVILILYSFKHWIVKKVCGKFRRIKIKHVKGKLTCYCTLTRAPSKVNVTRSRF